MAQPVTAQANLDVDGGPVRAHVAAARALSELSHQLIDAAAAGVEQITRKPAGVHL